MPDSKPVKLTLQYGQTVRRWARGHHRAWAAAALPLSTTTDVSSLYYQRYEAYYRSNFLLAPLNELGAGGAGGAVRRTTRNIGNNFVCDNSSNQPTSLHASVSSCGFSITAVIKISLTPPFYPKWLPRRKLTSRTTVSSWHDLDLAAIKLSQDT